MHCKRLTTNTPLFGLLLLISLLLPGLTAQAQFGQISRPHPVTPSLIAADQSLQPGQTAIIAVHFRIDPKWHLYWTNPEGPGNAPTVDWTLPEGYTISEARWPVPKYFDSFGFLQFGYEDELTLLYELTVPENASVTADLSAALTWLVCDVGNCWPNPGGQAKPAQVRIELPVSESVPQASDNAALIAKSDAKIPQQLSGWSFTTEVVEDGFTLVIQTPSEADAKTLEGAYFFSSRLHDIDPAAEQTLTIDGSTARLSLVQREFAPFEDEPIKRDTPITELAGVLKAKGGFGETGIKALSVGNTSTATPSTIAKADTPAAEAGTGVKTTFLAALGLAFVGGLVLNLLPCVFPVLSIKILGFVQQAGENPAIVRRHGYAFGAGVMLSFWALVTVLLILRGVAQATTDGGAASGAVGWGFQLQSPPFVLGMLLVVFLIGLNLIGAFEVGMGLSAAAGKASQAAKDGYGKSFFTGVLATMIATPCTGPLMAPALGFAISQPPLQAFLVFTALGVGMAAPYVILSCLPALLNYLPRPGAWMESFKQAMAFPMFATAGWLAWVYIGLTDDDFGLMILICLAIVAMGAWIYGRWTTPLRTARTKWIARATAFAFVVGSAGYIHFGAVKIEQQRLAAEQAREAGGYVYEWVDYSPEKITALRETGRPILIDFTAKWCATCQVNKRSSLRTGAAEVLYETYNVALVEADNTRSNPYIVETLGMYQRAGVPLYLVFPADGGDPEVLPELLTPKIVEDAIKRAAEKAAPTTSEATTASR